MAGYSLSAALNILNQLSVYPEYQGVSGLTKLLADTSISVPWASSNAISLLYSGMLGDTRSSSVARAISAASGGAVITVDQTQQGQLLSSSAFQDAFKSAASAAGYNTLDAETLMGGGTLTDGTRVIGGLWSNTSVVFTENASSIITITPTAGQDSVFYQFELASAVDNGIPINGIPAADLRSMPLAYAADVVNIISLGLVNQLKIATNTEGDIVGLETGSIFPTRTINTLANAPAGSIISTGSELLSGNSGVPAAADSLVIDPFASSTDNGHITGQNLADFQQGASSLSTVAADGVTLESLAGKGLTALGVVAIGYTFYEAEQTAQQQAASGNSAAAEKTMMDWTVTTVGGITGGALAAEYAAPLLLGGPVGWIGYGALVSGGGIAGSIAPSATQHLLDALTDSSSPVATSQTTNADGSVWNTLTYTNGIQASQLTYSPPGITLLYQDTVKVPDGNGGYTEFSASISSTGIDTKTSVYALADGQSALQSTTTLSADALGNTQEVISNWLGNPTEIIYDATQNGGGDTQTQSNLNSNGQIENSQSIDTQTSGSVFDSLSGMGAVANLNGAEVSLADGSSATVIGSNNSINAGAGSQTTINGSTDIVAGGVDDTVTVLGTGENITLGTGSTLVMTGTDEEASLSNGTVWLGANTTLTGSGLTGSNDVLNVSQNDSVVENGKDDTVNLSSGDSLVSNGGGNNIINAGVDDTVVIDSITAGYTDTVNATGDQSITLGNDVSVDVVGGGNTIFVAGTGDVLADSGDTIASSNVSLTIMNTSGAADLISGDGDTITANHSSISFGGVSEVLSGVYDTVGLETGSSLTLSLYDDTLNLSSGASVFISGGVGSGNIINAGVDDIVDIDSMTAGYTDTVNATGDQSITLGSDVSVDVVGSGNTITANGGDSVSANGDTILIAGIGNSLAGAGDTISSSNVSLTIMNTSGAADLISGDGDTITASHSSIMLSGVDEVMSGSYDTIGVNTGSSVTLTNYDDTINLSSGASLVTSGGGGNIINAGVDSTVYIGSTTIGADDTVNATGDQSITLGSDVSVDVVGSGNTILVAGTGDVLSGSGDTISSSNVSLTILNTSGTADLISGNNDTITANHSSISFSGMDEVLSGNYDTVGLGTGSSVTLTSYDETLNVNSGASVVISGGGNNIINAGVDDTVVIDSMFAGYIDTVNATDDQGIILGSDVSVDVVGAGNTITVNGGDSVSANGDTIQIAGIDNSLSGSGDTISSSNGSLTIMNTSGAADLISGNSDTITANHSSIMFGGVGEVLSGNYDTVGLGTSSSVTLTSYDDSINLSSGAGVVISGGGNNIINAGIDDSVVINSSSDGYANTVNATGDQNITLGSDVSVNVLGSGNTILVTGTGDVLTDSGDTVSSSNISLTIMNTSGTADFISGNNDTITTNRSSIMFGGVGEVMSGNYDTVGLATGSSVTLANYDDTVNMSSGASVIISGGGNNSINAGVDDTVIIDNSSSGYTETVNATGDQGITLCSDVSVNVVGSGNTVAANGGDRLSANGDTILIAGINNSLTGSGNTITSSNISLAIVNASAVANTITGDHDVIAVSHSVLNLNGSNEVVSGNDDVITVAHGESVIISGAGNTVTGSSDRITLSGDNSSLTIQGNGDNLTSSAVYDRIIDNRAYRSSVLYGWNSSGTETETVYSEANDGGQIIGGYGYSGPGIGVDVPVGYGGDDGGDGGDGGGYGFAGDRSLVSSAVGKNIGAIAQYDLNHANLSAADAAEVSQHQVQAIASLASTTGAGSAVLEGAKFDQQVITWSLADTQGTQAAQFSGYMGSADESVVQGAFNTWAAAMPGVTFKEVADSAQSDIRLGFGDFNTATTGVIGYTSYQANDGQIEPDAIVRVEDSAQEDRK